MTKNASTTILWVTLGAVILIGLMFLVWYISTYNSLVRLDESAQTQWSNVKVQYQRRADLIPNLIATVQGAANFESGTQTQIAELRTAAIAARDSLAQAKSLDEEVAAARQVDAVASRYSALNINVENYPQLRATENFASLQDELAGTENRIGVARTRYNEEVRLFNTRIRSFPASFVASSHGFERKPLFEADEGTQQAPTVSFT